MNIKWTTQEWEFLKDNLEMETEDLALILNKTPKSIRRKLEREGVKKSGRTPWTNDDQQLLLENITKDFSFVKELFKHKNINTVKQRYYGARSKLSRYLKGTEQ